ncbi:MAG: transporter [Verrucomicrobiaceae bacterium]|nr:transporter [Verrucomicrobiaceae bacterium]
MKTRCSTPIACLCAVITAAGASELNHFQPGIFGTRDFFVPAASGFYYSQMDFTYLSDEFRNGSGNVPGELTIARSLDLSRTISGSASFGLEKARNSGVTLNLQGSHLDLGATLDGTTALSASLDINAHATAQLQAEALIKAHIEDLDVRISGIAPTFIWVSETKVLGAKLAALVSLPIVDMSIDARIKGTADFSARVNGQLSLNAIANLGLSSTVAGTLSATTPRGKTVQLKSGSTSLTATTTKSKTITKDFSGELNLHQDIDFTIKDSRTDLGDLYVQPLWLGWAGDHYDIALSDGFYAPTGHYAEGALDNTGMGFWTNQTQLAAAWYPWKSKGTAITVATTYEVHGNKEGADIRPGSNLTVNWGVSQYVPLNKNMTWLADIGVGGYDIWQVSDDRGSDVTYDANVHDEVHAFGVQLGLAQVKWNAALTMRWMHEYAARDRFKGDMFVLNIAKKF